MISTYLADFSAECDRCGDPPCVVIHDGTGTHATNLCGPHFFGDRFMVDWELWNDQPESTE